VFFRSVRLALKPAPRAGPPPPDHAPHMDHDMSHMHMGGGQDFALTANETSVVNALAACQVAGEICLSHCLQSLAAMDTSMSGCASSVREALAVCRAIQALVEAHSSFAGQQLALCRDVCNACRTQCAQHAEHHVSCRVCADSCASVIAAIDTLLG